MVEFEKASQEAQKIEHEAFAINNFFKLLSQANVASLSQLPKKTFLAIGGSETLEKLIMDLKNENIDIFTNSVGELFLQLEHNIKCMNEVVWSKTFFTRQATEHFELYKTFYSASSGMKKVAYEDLASLQVISEEKIEEILSYETRERN